ncbi:MAG: glycosyltransferase family 4 protein [Parcubacteria group bacterium]|nr:glycosyltransferase family 4 protein [Parcubacteria group bacterium]
MKTLLFTLEYPPFHGGVANYYGNLVKYWPEPDYISVLHNNNGRLINNKLPLLKWLPAYFALRRKIKQEKIGHVLAGQILPLGTVSLIYRKFYKTKYSVILHGLDLAYALKQPRKKWLTGKILKNSKKIICTNSYVAKLARQTFPEIGPKIAVINPGVDNNFQFSIFNFQLRKKYNLENKIVLLSVGRLVKRKGFDMVIEAMPKVLPEAPNLIYVIIGDGEEIENCKLKIENFGLNGKVIFIQKADDNERNVWYAASDIFIMPAREINGDFEGFGLVYLEANAAGKPVIAGNSGGVGDAVIDGLNGLLVDPLNTAEIASAIIKLAQNPALRQKLGEQGRARALKEFNWPKQIDKMYKIINL